MVQDPYKVLGVSPGCSDEDLKNAYRKLAKQYHPDLHPNDAAAAEKMNEINAAYDQIKNPPKFGSGSQAYYGQSAGGYGQTGSASGQQNGSTGQYGQYGPFTYTYYSTGQNGQTEGYDPFEDIFRGFQQQSYTSYRRTVSPLRLIVRIILILSIVRFIFRALLGSFFYPMTGFYRVYPDTYGEQYSDNVSGNEQAYDTWNDIFGIQSDET